MIDAIVLAAGLGRRWGAAAKPLLDVDGETALGVVLCRIRAEGIARPIVVLGHSADAIREAVDLSNCHVIINPHPELGMGSSLAKGLNAVSPEAIGTLIFHVDMPFIRADTIRRVIDEADAGAHIAAPQFGVQRGFPVYFARSCFPELKEHLDGDTGGKGYIDAHPELLHVLPVEDPGCVHDVDRPEDLAAWKGGQPCATCA